MTDLTGFRKLSGLINYPDVGVFTNIKNGIPVFTGIGQFK